MAHLRTVERFLQAWDPIGIIEDEIDNGAPPTEYDTYAPKVLTLLQRGVSADDLVNHLSGLRREMGLDPDDFRDREAAGSIMHWWQTERATPAG